MGTKQSWISGEGRGREPTSRCWMGGLYRTKPRKKRFQPSEKGRRGLTSYGPKKGEPTVIMGKSAFTLGKLTEGRHCPP